MTATSIVRLKINLDDVKPVVMRRITVRFGIRLDLLHTIVQTSMGWSNSHLWEFRAGGTGWGPSGPDAGFGDGPPARQRCCACSITSAARRSNTSMILATAGCTASKSSGSSPTCPASINRFSSRQPGVARPKTSAGQGATWHSSQLSLIPCTAVTPNSPNVEIGRAHV